MKKILIFFLIVISFIIILFYNNVFSFISGKCVGHFMYPTKYQLKNNYDLNVIEDKASKIGFKTKTWNGQDSTLGFFNEYLEMRKMKNLHEYEILILKQSNEIETKFHISLQVFGLCNMNIEKIRGKFVDIANYLDIENDFIGNATFGKDSLNYLS